MEPKGPKEPPRSPQGTPKEPPSNPQGTPRKPLEAYGTQRNPTSLKTFIARQPYKNVLHLHLHLPPYSPPWSAKLKLSALKKLPTGDFAAVIYSLRFEKQCTFWAKTVHRMEKVCLLAGEMVEACASASLEEVRCLWCQK